MLSGHESCTKPPRGTVSDTGDGLLHLAIDRIFAKLCTKSGKLDSNVLFVVLGKALG